MSIKIYSAFAPIWQEFQEALAAVGTLERSRNALPRACFIGRFKTGKSYLINALVGEDVLPHDTDECTAQIVELVYGSDRRASRLNSHDLDTAQETPLTLKQFEKAIDLTQMPGKGKQDMEDTAFRCYLPSPLLDSCRLIDTPGFDGTNAEVRERAEKAREQAIRQSSFCVLVVTKNAGEDEINCVRLIQQHKVPFIVVLNQSDKYDVEAIEEIQDQTLSDLEQKAGISPPFFACSALWEFGSAKDREAIEYQRRYFDDADVAEWHQWEALVRYLSRPRFGEKQRMLLAALRHALELAGRIEEEYDLTRQAEVLFLDDLSQWQARMSSLVGKTVLELAVSSARSGRQLPWKRLENFGIVPEDLAPKSLLAVGTVTFLCRLYAETLAEITELAWEQHSPVLYRFILSEQHSWDACLKKDFSAISELSQTMVRYKEAAAWYSQPLRTDFRYEEALGNLQKRWKTAPHIMNTELTRLRTRLAAALA